jgi:hypothetical protein
MGPQPRVLTAGTIPVAIRLARLGIDTDVEALDFVYDLPAEPSTPWVTAWYRNSSLLGESGLALIGGKTTVDDAGPAAFTRLSEVVAGDIIELTGQNGGSYSYTVESLDPEAKTPNFEELFAARDADRLMLVGWDEKFPSSLSSRTIVVVTAKRQS